MINKFLLVQQSFCNKLKQGSWKNLLTLNSIFKIIFLYCVTILCIIIFYFDFSSNAFKGTSSYKIAVYSVGRIGEHQSYLRSIRAMKKLGWEYIGATLPEEMINFSLTRHFFIVTCYIMHKLAQPEVNIALTHHVSILPPGYNLTYLNVPDDMLYSLKDNFVESFKHLKNYDGYIDLHSMVHGENKLLKKILHNYGKDNAPIIPAYLAQNQEEFIAANNYNNIIITGSLWGCNRGSYRMKKILLKLANDRLLVAYGPEYALEFLGDAYKGQADKHGAATDKLISLQREAGITLVVHSLEHLIEGLPTSRFAEAITAGAVIIADDHQFLRSIFGDNLLYFNSFQTSDEMYNQIKSHITWIKSHPNEARQMTQNSYDIFVKDWTLEAQLPRVMQMVAASLSAK
jgi:hypothetical protein